MAQNIANLLTIGLTCVALSAPSVMAGGFNVDLRLGNTSVRANTSGFSARASFGTHRYDRGARERSGEYDRRDRYDRKKRKVIIVPVRERTIVRERTVVRERPRDPDVVVVETPVPQPIAPPQPLDPQGSARIIPARGSITAPVEYELGAFLSPDQPHVTLDYRRYGLPAPPAGQIYARVGRDVLRIDATSRQIVAVVAN